MPRSSSLKSVAVILGAILLTSVSARAADVTSGATLFAQNCSACHQLNGKGVQGAFPALAGDVLVQGPTEKPVKVLLNGRGGMPSFRADLSDGQIASVLTYVRGAWGNHAPKIETASVAKLRGSPAANQAAQALQAH